MITFQRDGSQVLEKEFLGGNTGDRLGGDLQFKRAEKEFMMESLLKCSMEREVMDLQDGQEETCLKCS